MDAARESRIEASIGEFWHYRPKNQIYNGTMRLGCFAIATMILPCAAAAQRVAKYVANLDISAELPIMSRYDADRKLWLHYGGG